MKKITSLVLVLAIVAMCFCACGVNTEEVDAALEGSWTYSWYASLADMYCASAYAFEDGRVSYVFIGANESSKLGTYEIKRNTIECTWDDGSNTILNYTFKDGNLTLVDKGDGSINNVYEKYE